MQDKKSCLLLAFLVTGFVVINVLTLHDGHNWGGDFSRYIRQAQNILENKPYDFSYNLDPWANYPAGFPLLLAPLIKIFGLNYKILKLPNILYWLIFLCALYPIMKKRIGEKNALLGIMVLATSPYFFLFKQNILSELPFVAFLYPGIYFFEKYFNQEKKASSQKIYLIAISLLLFFCCVFIRIIGFVIFISALFYIVVTKKDKTALMATLGATAACMIALFLSKTSIESYLFEFSYISLYERILAFNVHILYTFLQFVLFFIPVKTNFTIMFFSVLSPIISLMFYSIFLFMIFSFIYKTIKRSLGLIDCFSMFYLLAIITWGVESGPRYILPLVGLMIIFFVESFNFAYTIFLRGKSNAFHPIKDILIQIFFLMIIFHNIISIALVFNFSDDAIKSPVTAEMVAWVKQNTTPHDRFMHVKPRVWGLLTGRKATTFTNHPQDKNIKERIRKFNIDYLVFNKAEAMFVFSPFNDPTFSLEQLKTPRLINLHSGNLSCIQKFNLSDMLYDDPVWQNKGFAIYKTKRDF